MATPHSPARVLAIDPGCTMSAYVLMDREYRPLRFAKAPNDEVADVVAEITCDDDVQVVIEMVACYGMAVGKEVFETCVWIGRYVEIARGAERIVRPDVKLNLCGQVRSKDANVRRALIDRFARHDLKNGKGTKRAPDWFYGFRADLWAAYAVGVTYLDRVKEDER